MIDQSSFSFHFHRGTCRSTCIIIDWLEPFCQFFWGTLWYTAISIQHKVAMCSLSPGTSLSHQRQQFFRCKGMHFGFPRVSNVWFIWLFRGVNWTAFLQILGVGTRYAEGVQCVNVPWQRLELQRVSEFCIFKRLCLGNPYRSPQDKKTHFICVFQASVVCICVKQLLYEFDFFAT